MKTPRCLAALAIGVALFAVIGNSALAFQSASRYSLAQGQQFTNAGRQLLSISPDGSQFVYVANNILFVKGIADRDARMLDGAQGNITNPVFSPDGKFIAFWSGQDSTLKRIAVSGGSPQLICQASNPYGMSWATDGSIVFGQGAAGIRRVPSTGGAAETIVTVKNGELAHGPQLLPGGNSVLYTLASNSNPLASLPPELANALNDPQQVANLRNNPQVLNLIASLNSGSMWDRAKIVVQSLKSSESKTLVEGGSDARYVPTGHIVYAAAGRLMAIGFDAARLEVSGSPVKLLDGVRNAGATTGTTQFSFSNTGSLVYIRADSGQSQRQMAFVDFAGKVTPLRHVPDSIFGPRISPDGKQVAYRDGNAVWIADLSSEAAPRRLTTEPGEAPVWSPDGQRIVFISIYNGMEALFLRRADGTGTAELLADRARAPESWSINQLVTFITLVGPSGDAGDYDIWTYSFQDRKASPLVVIPPSAQSGSRLSPDGRWLAYESNESGRAQVYVEPMPRNGQRFQISKTGGARPLWALDMSKLYFDNNAGTGAARMLSVNVRTQPGFSATDPETLPMTGFIQPSGTIRRQFDITPDGKQFLMTFPPVPVAPQIEIVPNWFDQMKAR